MRGKMARLAVMAAALSAASAVQAGDTEDFSGCDGRMKPKSKEDGMRGEASIPAYSRTAFGAGAKARIDACNRALANPKLLPGQTLRKAHLLRARAAAYLEQGEYATALADLDAADATLAPFAQEPFHRRSMGASLLLLRALAKAGAGELEEAARLADEAKALRPYAVQVQFAAAMVRHAARPIGQPSASPWGELIRLEPGLRRLTIGREAEVANFVGVVEAAKAAPIVWPDKPVGPYALLVTQGPGAEFASALDASVHLAYAQAATGDAAASRRTIALVREKLAGMASIPKKIDAAATTTAPPAADPMIELAKAFVEPRLRLAEARIALAEGRTEEAREAVIGPKLAMNAATLELLDALAKAGALPNGTPLKAGETLVPALGKERNRALGKLASTLLIAPESPRTLIDYKQSRPNIFRALLGGALSMGTSLLGGIERTQGFRSKTNPDGTVEVEYLGSTPSAPMVQEMTLLRAAELAQAAGKPRFTIVDRKDYARFLAMSRYGIEESRTPSGYKTELTIRMLDATADDTASFDAVAIIDALGPLYYEDKTRVAAK